MNFSNFITESDVGTVKYAYYALCNSDIMAKIKKAYSKPSQVDMENEGTYVKISVHPKDGTIPDLASMKSRVTSLVKQILKSEGLTPTIKFGDDIKIYV